MEFGAALADKTENILPRTGAADAPFPHIPPVNSMLSAPAPLIFAFLAQEPIQRFSNSKLTLDGPCKLCQIAQWFHFKAVKEAGVTLEKL